MRLNCYAMPITYRTDLKEIGVVRKPIHIIYNEKGNCKTVPNLHKIS